MLPDVEPGYVRLYRVDGRIQKFLSQLPDRTRDAVENRISGRWFSDNVAYISRCYAKPWTVWTYVDVPKDVAEAARYENVSKTPEGRNLYGVEGRDFFLPKEWADKRIRIDAPPAISGTPQPKQHISELTSNVAKKGRVLFYVPGTRYITVVKHVSSDNSTAVIFMRSSTGEEEWVVPIRRVEKLWTILGTSTVDFDNNHNSV